MDAYNKLLKELKEWQVRCGRFAALANFAALTALDHVDTESDENKQLNDILDEVIPFLVYDEVN